MVKAADQAQFGFETAIRKVRMVTKFVGAVPTGKKAGGKGEAR